jgi:hypothetical protein
MSQPNFQAMSQKELQGYVLEHREDQEAFYAYVDRLHVESKWVKMPLMQSEQDFKNYPGFIERMLRGAKSQDQSL